MKKSLQLLAALSVVFLFNCKTAHKTAHEAKAPNTSIANSLLWKLDKEGQPSSYILGTIHLIDADKYEFSTESEQAFYQAEELAMELDMSQMENPAVMMEIMSKAKMTDGQTLKQLVDEDDYQIVSDYFQQMGLPFFMLEDIKPFFLSMLVDLDMQSLGEENTKSYEMELTQMAKSQNKPILGLETIEFQLSLFDEIPYEEQAKMLVAAIENKGQTNNKLEEITNIYLTQNIDKMHDMIANSDPMMSKYMDQLITSRNENWIPKIMELTKDKSLFIAVGAGHLGGEKGVIRLLQNEGYTLSPLHIAN